ncbi:hypothetical protein [Bradyrhizobium liaoningense]
MYTSSILVVASIIKLWNYLLNPFIGGSAHRPAGGLPAFICRLLSGRILPSASSKQGRLSQPPVLSGGFFRAIFVTPSASPPARGRYKVQ